MNTNGTTTTDEAPTTARTVAEIIAGGDPLEILNAKMPDWLQAGDPGFADRMVERAQLEEAREQIEDEVAYARVLARRFALPEKAWPGTATDPRRAAWRDVLWDRARAAAETLRYDGLDRKRPAAGSPEFERASKALATASRAVALLQEEDDVIHAR